MALNRPTFMSSVFSDASFGGEFSASKAVDGNKDTNAMHANNSCVYSLTEYNPWWAVDLGAALSVLGILFTNRGDDAGNVVYIYFVTPSYGSVLGLGPRKIWQFSVFRSVVLII